MLVACDFHNHSCLSPCGSLEQSPSVLARLARERGLGLVALTDHNSALNTPAFAERAAAEGVAALYGIEATSAEEVHVLCLFSEVRAALDFGRFLEERLPRLAYDPDKLGDQVVVDADENVLDLPQLYFGAALELDYGELCESAAERGALVVPAHIDRPMFGAISQLGFLPDGPYAAVEAVRPLPDGAARGYAVITGSDAHYPEHVARRPFGLELADGWDSGGEVDLEAVRAALVEGRVRLPFAT
ncbi:MAG TPA: PHP domain-containing protein [Spirochaetia bacterium]|nr:PHP domain-containing protein [Spirochaetaceae bacterium]HPE88876.1 PHP domain-containing protein [Spirochaetales bacterium]HRW24703.1 PHP domain-containing protein [Spirochaetia bacterium]